MANKLVSVEAILLHGHFSLNHRFSDGVNIIYGNNGGGKTTLLNILANALNGNFNQFAFLEFSSIKIEFDDGKVLLISKTPAQDYEEETINISLDDDFVLSISLSEITANYDCLGKNYTDLLNYELPSILHFPAYRILYDYLKASPQEDRYSLPAFFPLIDFPNIKEIENRLKNDAAQEDVSPKIKLFLDGVNKFYENKKLVINPKSEKAPFEIIYSDKKTSKELISLSSGERQITTMMYALSHTKPGGIILIDEPEISLHIEWQRKILRIISSMFQPNQIIACTHSPVIGADFELNELEFRFIGGSL